MSIIKFNDFEYETGDPTGSDCPTPQACGYCHFHRIIRIAQRICLWPKVLYGNREAFLEYKNSKIKLKDLIDKYEDKT